MIRLSEIIEKLEALAPPQLKEEWDNVGLLVGDEKQRIGKIYVCLDVTSENVSEATDFGADLIISHHPLIFKPLYSVTERDSTASIVRTLIRNNICVYSMHTNFDKADGGMNDILAERLGLENIRRFTPDECFDAVGNKLDGIGRIGVLERPMTVREFMAHIKEALGCKAMKYVGDPEEAVQSVALCSGSGGSDIYTAYRSGADIYVTADLNHHHAQTAKEINLNVVDAGHFETENIICDFMENFLYENFSGIEVMKSTAVSFFSV